MTSADLPLTDIFDILQDAAHTPFFFQEFAAARQPPAAHAIVQIRTRQRQRITRRAAHGSRAVADAHGGRADTPAGLASITERVAAAAAMIVGRAVHPQQPLMEAGLDSLGAHLRLSCLVARQPATDMHT